MDGVARVRDLRLTDIPGWMDADELTWLYRMASRGGRIIEIGTYHGRSTCALLAGLRDAGYGPCNLLCVDTFDWRSTSTEHVTPLEGLRQWSTEVAMRGCGMPSVMWADSLHAGTWIDRQCATLVFIDGDHEYAAIGRDIDLWVRAVAPGGYIAGHDYHPNWPGVMSAVDERFPDAEHGPGSIWYVRRA